MENALSSTSASSWPATRPPSPTTSTIPESLLSLAKDERYIHQCQILLDQLLESVSFLFLRPSGFGGMGLGGDGNHIDESNEEQESSSIILKRRTWLISYLLYALLIVIPNGRTLGMELLNLQFSASCGPQKTDKTSSSTTKNLLVRRRIIACTLLTVGAGWILDRLSRKKTSVQQLHVRSTTPTTAAAIDILRSSSVEIRVNNSHSSGESCNSTNNWNRENLRGRDRREQHDRLRRQMLERSSRLSCQTSDGGSNKSFDSNNIIISPNATSSSSSSDQQELHLQGVISNRRRRYRLQDRVHSWLQEFARSLLDGLFFTEGPHQVSSTMLSTSINTYSVARWLVHLHLAQYLITGKFPSWIYRFVGLTMEPKGQCGQHQRQNSSVISIRPDSSHHIIALLIFLQASSSVVRRVWNSTAQMMASQTIGRPRNERRYQQLMLLPSSTVSSNGNTHTTTTTSPTLSMKPSELRRRWFQHAMAQYFVDNKSIPVNNETTVRRNNGSGTVENIVFGDNESNRHKTMMQCTICRTQRQHPAASVKCGHVTCWDCLMNWVTNVRPECPLCRTPCQPQDIMILLGYQ